MPAGEQFWISEMIKYASALAADSAMSRQQRG